MQTKNIIDNGNTKRLLSRAVTTAAARKTKIEKPTLVTCRRRVHVCVAMRIMPGDHSLRRFIALSHLAGTTATL